MDFGTLLHVAKRKNEEIAKSSANNYYSTKFSAPKKESKDKKLSANIKKFLAKREEEEREKARIEKLKRDQLLASRDEKAKNKIKKMLKVIKSANKSAIDDAVDEQNTAVTIQGPDQPDEDDYGYVSQEASALYKRYMDRVKTTPEENKFAPSRPSSRTDLAGTKDRVRAAIMKEQEEVHTGSRTKSSSSSSSSTTPSSSKLHDALASSSASTGTHRRKDLYDPQLEKEIEEKKRREEAKQKARNRPAAPPPMDFQQLLKLAEKKQHEPIEVVVEPTKEPERLLTKKEKKELEERELREQRRKERKALGNKESPTAGGSSRETPAVNKMQPNGRIPKLNGSSSMPTDNRPPQSKFGSSGTPSKVDNFKRPSMPVAARNDSPKQKFDAKPTPTTSSTKPKSFSQPNSSSSSKPSTPKPTASQKVASKPTSSALSSSSSSSSSQKSQSKQPYNGPTRQFPPADAPKKSQSQNGRSELQNGRSGSASSARDQIPQKTRQFPPSDVRRDPPPRSRPPQQPIKRRIYDDYDDDEYDSELDDFIDDGPQEGENYSSYIKEIFGYDRSRYRDVDEDDAGMESSFAQQMREEFISKKIGLMEDLEDMRLEEEEKRRKTINKKRKLK